MHAINRATALAACAIAFAAPTAGRADVYCVATASELHQALAAAAASAADDQIRLRAGTYAATQTFTYPAATSGWLELSGGWIDENDVPCARTSQRAGDTVLDGLSEHQVFNLSYTPATPAATAPRFALSHLSVRNGVGAGFTRGGGLALQSNAEGPAEIWLDNVAVTGSRGYFGGGAHLYLKKGLLRIANTLFANNEAPESAYGHAAITVLGGETAYSVTIVNSTFVGGRCAGQGTRGCGIGAGLGAGAHMAVVNSLFDDNALSDVSMEGLAVIGLGNGSVAYDHSRVPVSSGTFAPTISAPLEDEPHFVGASDFRLADDSPLLDRGLGTVPIVPLGGADLDGRPRLRYAALDPGAYENQTWDTLLTEDFEAQD
ncbi:MAG: hypothetical protein DI564_10830 [Rhodanobacter denitrificans]|uniref:Right handed beta helix domain-containing protein n=1 Tax=Rhodanobacter denitrificans TaxID=666685 RepID=A0A2W5M2T8_9GAMM|nr:MAG: hypothetical protein DI564_10830 [Rhodanobacter denitrificans]